MIKAPSKFRVIAIISTFNEEDIIVPVIKHLFNEGVSVYLIDNWSTDHTFELVSQLRHSDLLIGIERWPQDGPSPTFDWEEILKRKEVLSQTFDSDWYMHYDADEIRESPWLSIKLKEAIYIVDQFGYNAIDFAVLNFYPVDNNYIPGSSPVDYFKFFLFDNSIGNKSQIKAWKRQNEPINLSKYGGHLVEFEGRKVFPYKFIMRHYPIRSQRHGERKILFERKPRFNPQEKKVGWHIHYDHFHDSTNFLKNPADLIKFQSNFYDEFIFKQIMERDIEQIMEREQIMKEYANHQSELNNHIARLDQNVTALKNEIETLKGVIEEKDRVIREKERDRVIREKDKIIEDKNKVIEDKDRLIREKDKIIEDKNKVIEDKDGIINELLNSRSWQVTKPLRQIDALVRRFRNL